MTRIGPWQLKYVAFKNDSRYLPVKKKSLGGILCLVDKTPNEPRDLIPLSVPQVIPPAVTDGVIPVANETDFEGEPAVPEPFEYREQE